MSIIIRQPTSNETPDSGQGGQAVTSPSNTGHASTGADAIGDEFGFPVTKTCRWSSFQAFSGTIPSLKLKITHSSSGSLIGPSASNQFTLAYSLNGGSNWTTAVSRTNFTASQNNTFSVDLPPGQDISQIQVRDLIQAQAFNIGDFASASAIISDIKLEIITPDGPLVVMM